jgi:hypothetical protein
MHRVYSRDVAGHVHQPESATRRPGGRQFVRAGPSGGSPKAQEHPRLRALRETAGVQIEEKECF